MLKIRHLLLCLLLVVVSVANAQSKTVTGQVTSESDGQAIPGATVLVVGENGGTVTDISGNYSIEVSSNDAVLKFSFIGKTTKEVKVGNQTTINVVLASSALQMDEVVVTALGITKQEKALGSSVTSVSNEELTSIRTADMNSAISGKIAGVQITSSSTDPGASSSVIIRGISSISGNNQPLYVVDGVPMDNTSSTGSDQLNNGYDYGTGSNMINPDDVQTMSVLKGAAATALYGSRAANGVVMITTKKGSKNKKGLGINVNQGYQMSTILRLPEFQNDFGMGWDGHHTEIENGSWGPRFDNRPHLWGQTYNYSQKLKSFSPLENNVKDFFENGSTWNTSVSINGGNDKGTYYASYSNINDDGLIPSKADTYKRNTFNVNSDYDFGRVKLSSTVNYSVQENNFTPTGQGLTVVNSLYQIPRDISIVDLQDWKSDPFDTPDYYFTPYGVLNPYWLINYTQRKFEQNKLLGKVQADIDITDDLMFTYRLGYDATSNINKQGFPKVEITPGSAADNTGASYEDPGKVSKSMSQRTQINQDFLLMYNKEIIDGLNLDGLAGINLNQREYSYVGASVTDLDIFDYYDLSNSSATPSVNEHYSIRRLVGAFANIDLSYKRFLYLTLTARNDWSSTLPVENNSFFYPGVTGSFVFSEFTETTTVSDWLSFGKVRLAYGQTGNDADPYMTKPSYIQGAAYNAFNNITLPLGGINAYELSNTLANSNLGPEITTEFEAGLDLRFFNDRVKLDAAYYHRKSDGQIFSLDMDAASGFTSQVVNFGTVQNSGIEILASFTPVQTNDLKWTITGVFSKNNNKVLELPDEMGDEVTIYSFGTATSTTSMVAREGHEIGEFKVTKPKTDGNGNVVVNPSNGLPIADPELQYHGSVNSKYELGLSTSFEYKGFSLSAAFDYRNGGYMYSRTKDILAFTGNSIHTTYNDRNPFIVPNSVNEVVTDGNVSYEPNTTMVAGSDMLTYFADGQDQLNADFLIPRDFLKLRNVSIGYTLPRQWLNGLPIESIKVSVFGSNLFVWTPSENTFIDPELSTFGNDLQGKFGEYSANPTTRKFGYNLQIKF